MATLKDLIKKETMLVAAHSATPGDVSIAIETDKKETASWLDVATFTAPSAGSVEVTARGNGAGTSAIQIAAAIVHTHAWTGTMLNRITIQASKGRTVYVSGQNFKELSVRFIKSIGGGYKRYLKALVCNRFGGSSWLRLKTTSEWNKARSCLQTRSGLRLSLRPRLSVASTFNLQRLTVKPISLLQKLVGYISKPSQLTKVPTLTLFPSAKKRGCRVAAQQFKQANYLLHKLLCKREGCSTYGLKQSLPMLCTLFRQLVASNNARMEVAA